MVVFPSRNETMKKSFHFIFFLIAAAISIAQSDSAISEKNVIQAIKENDFATVLRFINEGNDIDGFYGKQEMTLLNLAIKSGNGELATKLINFGADKNKESNGKTPLMYCMQFRQIKLMRFLIRNGCDLNAKAKNGNTALIFATKMNKLEDVMLLVENGADVSLVNDNKLNALDIANFADFVEIAEYLVKITEFRHFYNNEPPYTDGPYVDWVNDSLCRMYYFVFDTLRKVPLLLDECCSAKGDTINLKGFVYDTNEYQVLRNHHPKPAIYENVTKILTIGDFHGHYMALINYLIINKVIDQNHHWIWGDGHLVFGGDVCDRGSEVTESLWFIYQLDLQARKAGGEVHMLLGNHEVMVLNNDTRYLNDKYAFFAKYFSRDYSSLFGKNTEFGKWLRSQNVVLKINGLLFCHAGISPMVLSQHIQIEEINSISRNYLNSDNSSKKDDKTNSHHRLHCPCCSISRNRI